MDEVELLLEGYAGAVNTVCYDEREKVTAEYAKRIRRYLKPPPYACPKCGGPTHWRQGVHFDHMRRCPVCDYSWEPQ